MDKLVLCVAAVVLVNAHSYAPPRPNLSSNSVDTFVDLSQNTFTFGQKVEALYRATWMKAIIVNVNPDNTYDIQYLSPSVDPTFIDQKVPASKIRATQSNDYYIGMTVLGYNNTEWKQGVIVGLDVNGRFCLRFPGDGVDRCNFTTAQLQTPATVSTATCPSDAIVVPGLASLGNDRTNLDFAQEARITPPSSNQDTTIVTLCSNLNGQWMGSIVTNCGSNGRWEVKGGCRRKTCPEYNHWSNGAMVVFAESPSGTELTRNCPLFFATKYYTGTVTLSCGEGQTSWGGASGSCTPCDLTCVGGSLEPSECRCVCRDGYVGTRCETCSRTCTAGQGWLDAKVCGCNCRTGFSGKQCEIAITPLKPADLGFPLFYLVMFLWRNLGELLHPTLFLIMMLLLKVHTELGLS